MKRRTKWSALALGAAALTLSGGLMSGSEAQAQPGAGDTAGAAGGAAAGGGGRSKRARRARQPRGARALAREVAAIEKATGKTLTEAQKTELGASLSARQQAVRAAQEKHLANVARMTGMTVEELRLKMRQARAATRRGGKAGKPAGAAAGAG